MLASEVPYYGAWFHYFVHRGSLIFFFRPMAPRQPSRYSVVNPDVVFCSVPCLSLDFRPMAQPPLGPRGIGTIFICPSQREMFFSLFRLYFRVYIFLFVPSHPCAQWPCPSCFRRSNVAGRSKVHNVPRAPTDVSSTTDRVATLAMRRLCLITRCRGICSLIFVCFE